jgi:hypothetical protein
MKVEIEIDDDASSLIVRKSLKESIELCLNRPYLFVENGTQLIDALKMVLAWYSVPDDPALTEYFAKIAIMEIKVRDCIKGDYPA